VSRSFLCVCCAMPAKVKVESHPDESVQRGVECSEIERKSAKVGGVPLKGTRAVRQSAIGNAVTYGCSTHG